MNKVYVLIGSKQKCNDYILTDLARDIDVISCHIIRDFKPTNPISLQQKMADKISEEWYLGDEADFIITTRDKLNVPILRSHQYEVKNIFVGGNDGE